MTLNLHSHSRADLSRNHKVIDELLDLVVPTEVSTERAAFTTNSAGWGVKSGDSVGDSRSNPEQSSLPPSPDPQIHPKSSATVSPGEGCSSNASLNLPAADKSVEYSQIHLPVGQSEERNSVCELPEAKPALPEPFTPKTLTAEELAQAEDAYYFDLRSDFDQMYGREEFEEER